MTKDSQIDALIRYFRLFRMRRSLDVAMCHIMTNINLFFKPDEW